MRSDTAFVVVVVVVVLLLLLLLLLLLFSPFFSCFVFSPLLLCCFPLVTADDKPIYRTNTSTPRIAGRAFPPNLPCPLPGNDSRCDTAKKPRFSHTNVGGSAPPILNGVKQRPRINALVSSAFVSTHCTSLCDCTRQEAQKREREEKKKKKKKLGKLRK